jgi:hypothetical protein
VCCCNYNLELTTVKLLEDFVDSVTISNKSVGVSINSIVLLCSVTTGLIKYTYRSYCSEVYLLRESICICLIVVISRKIYLLNITIILLITSTSS